MKALLVLFFALSTALISQATVHVGDSVIFSVTKTDLKNQVTSFEAKTQVSNIENYKVYVETFISGVSNGISWQNLSDFDGEIRFKFSPADLGKACQVGSSNGVIVETQVPVGNFIACHINNQFYGNGAYTHIETWYSSVLGGVIKSKVFNDYGIGKSSESESVLQAIN